MSEVGLQPTLTYVDCDLNAAPQTAWPFWPVRVTVILKIGWKLQMTIDCYANCNLKLLNWIEHFVGALFGLSPPHLSCSTATFAALQLVIQRRIEQAAVIRTLLVANPFTPGGTRAHNIELEIQHARPLRHGGDGNLYLLFSLNILQGWNALRSLRFLSNCKVLVWVAFRKQLLKILPTYFIVFSSNWLRGAMVARLTPDQKAACSSHVGVTLDPYGIIADVEFLNSSQSS